MSLSSSCLCLLWAQPQIHHSWEYPKNYFLPISKGRKPLLSHLRQECCQRAETVVGGAGHQGHRVKGYSFKTFPVWMRQDDCHPGSALWALWREPVPLPQPRALQGQVHGLWDRRKVTIRVNWGQMPPSPARASTGLWMLILESTAKPGKLLFLLLRSFYLELFYSLRSFCRHWLCLNVKSYYKSSFLFAFYYYFHKQFWNTLTILTSLVKFTWDRWN